MVFRPMALFLGSWHYRKRMQTAVVTKVAELTPSQRKLVDEYVEAREQWKSWQPAVNPHAARYEQLKAEILTWFAERPANHAFIAQGDSFTLPISPRENKRNVINTLKLVRTLGLKWVAENCKPTLTAIEKALSPEKREQFITESREGPRSIGEPARVAAVQKAA